MLSAPMTIKLIKITEDDRWGGNVLLYILPQSSGDFDPETDPELKKPPDPSELRSGGILVNIVFRFGQKLC